MLTFMTVEIIMRLYHFNLDLQDIIDKQLEIVDQILLQPGFSLQVAQFEPIEGPFFHYDLHDLESLW